MLCTPDVIGLWRRAGLCNLSSRKEVLKVHLSDALYTWCCISDALYIWCCISYIWCFVHLMLCTSDALYIWCCISYIWCFVHLMLYIVYLMLCLSDALYIWCFVYLMLCISDAFFYLMLCTSDALYTWCCISYIWCFVHLMLYLSDALYTRCCCVCGVGQACATFLAGKKCERYTCLMLLCQWRRAGLCKADNRKEVLAVLATKRSASYACYRKEELAMLVNTLVAGRLP